MSYQSGYLPVDAGGGQVQALLDILEGMMLDHAAWSYAGIAGTGTNAYRVWRNLGAENAAGKDFHIGIQDPLEAGLSTLLRFVAFENFDNVTKGLARPCMRNATAKALGADASLDNGAFYTSGVNYFGGTALFNSTLWAPVNGGVEYWFSVTPNRLILATRRDSDLAVNSLYVGHFESFIPDHPNESPLVIISPHQTSTSLTVYTVGAWSRHPGRESTTDRENLACYPMIAGTASDWTKTYGQIGNANSGDLFHGGKVIGSRMLARPLSSSFSIYGYLRGLYLNILDIPVVAGVAVGDTVTIDGDTWVYLGANGNWMNASA